MFQALLDRFFKDKPDRDAFARLYMASVRKRLGERTMVYERDEFRILGDNGSFFNLHNAYHAYVRAPRGQQRETLEVFSRLFGQHNQEDLTLDRARPLLRPILRSLAQLEQIRLHHAEQDGWEAPCPLHYRLLSPECVELLAVDHPDHTSTLTRGPSEAWGIDLDAALAIARQNLRDDSDMRFVDVAGVFVGAWADAYDSSRALLPELLHRLPLNGAPVFMLANRDSLLVTGERDEDAQARMLEMAAKAFDEGRVISWEMFRYDDNGRPQVHTPASEMLRRRQRALRLDFDADAYAAQKQALERIHAVTGEDVFVASFLRLEKDGDVFSLGTWTDGVATSLPRTDRIALVMPVEDDYSDNVVVAWEQAMPILEHLLQRDERHLHPPRFLTRGFPDAALRARLQPVD